MPKMFHKPGRNPEIKVILEKKIRGRLLNAYSMADSRLTIKILYRSYYHPLVLEPNEFQAKTY